MIEVKKLTLADVRTDLLLRQVDLAKRAGVTSMTVSRSEKGETIQRLSAKKILQALNRARREQGQAELVIEDLTWKVR